MGVIMVFGIIGLGLAAPVIYPAIFFYSIMENFYYSVKDFFENLDF